MPRRAPADRRHETTAIELVLRLTRSEAGAEKRDEAPAKAKPGAKKTGKEPRESDERLL